MDYYIQSIPENFIYTINEDLLNYDTSIKKSQTHMPKDIEIYDNIMAELRSTYIKKNHDYGNSFDESLNTFGPIASVVRLSDKFNRLKTLSKEQSLVKNESIEDTFLDMANYCIMTVKWLRDTHTN